MAYKKLSVLCTLFYSNGSGGEINQPFDTTVLSTLSGSRIIKHVERLGRAMCHKKGRTFIRASIRFMDYYHPTFHAKPPKSPTTE